MPGYFVDLEGDSITNIYIQVLNMFSVFLSYFE